MGFYRWQWYYNKTRHENTRTTQTHHTTIEQNTAFKATQTTKDTLHAMNSKKNKLRGLSPRANYANRAIATCWRSYYQLLRIDDATWSA
jgi:hypothetical protein